MSLVVVALAMMTTPMIAIPIVVLRRPVPVIRPENIGLPDGLLDRK